MSASMLRRGAVLVSVAVLALPGVAGAEIAPRPGALELVSRGSDGSVPERDSYSPALSADGRFVAFETAAALVPEDTNEMSDVYVLDRVTSMPELVSVGPDGLPANSGSGRPALSEDGRFVAFFSAADNLVPGDTNEVPDIFVRDRLAGVTERVTVSSAGVEQDDGAFFADISADGRYVVFDSVARNLVPGGSNNLSHIYLHDRTAGTTERVNVGPGGVVANGISGEPAISADGRYVGFVSFASNLVAADLNQTQDVFVHDTATGELERVNVATDGSEANHISFGVDLSGDGRFVAFQSLASNLAPNDMNGREDTFVKDRATGAIERISLGSSGEETSSFSDPSISLDGRYIAWSSADARLTPGPGYLNVYLHDRLTHSTERISETEAGVVGDRTSWHPAISADGRHVAFESNSGNLLPGAGNGRQHVYVRDRGPALGVGGLAAARDGATTEVSGWSTFSGVAVSEASAPSGDAPPGADLVGARVVLRPERGDLLVRLDLDALPGIREPGAVCALALFTCAPSISGLPGLVYGVGFEADGVRYEARILRAAATASDPNAPAAALYRCDAACEEIGTLSGAVGTGGDHVTAAVPLASLEGASALTEVRAFSGAGEAATGALALFDEVELPGATVAAPHVMLGIAPDGVPQEDVVFATDATTSAGWFSATLEIPDGHVLWARACLGDTCGVPLAATPA